MKKLISFFVLVVACAASASFLNVATERYVDMLESFIRDAFGNKISADRTVVARASVFKGYGDANYDLVQTVYDTNRWEAVVGGVQKALWWNGSSWQCSGYDDPETGYEPEITAIPSGIGATNITIAWSEELSLLDKFDRNTAVVPYGKVVTTAELTRQMVFDISHPVGDLFMQFTAIDDPNNLFNKNGIVSTWTDITGAINRDGKLRYIQLDNTVVVNTPKGESLPNIRGNVQVGREGAFTMNVFNAAGAFWTDFTYQQFMANGGDLSNNNNIRLNFSASNSSSVYQDNAAVQPYTITVKIWRRTS